MLRERERERAVQGGARSVPAGWAQQPRSVTAIKGGGRIMTPTGRSVRQECKLDQERGGAKGRGPYSPAMSGYGDAAIPRPLAEAVQEEGGRFSRSVMRDKRGYRGGAESVWRPWSALARRCRLASNDRGRGGEAAGSEQSNAK
ncbi:hypothetical protein ACQY0O_000729 [Thecaphora frezii]